MRQKVRVSDRTLCVGSVSFQIVLLVLPGCIVQRLQCGVTRCDCSDEADDRLRTIHRGEDNGEAVARCKLDGNASAHSILG